LLELSIASKIHPKFRKLRKKRNCANIRESVPKVTKVGESVPKVEKV